MAEKLPKGPVNPAEETAPTPLTDKENNDFAEIARNFENPQSISGEKAAEVGASPEAEDFEPYSVLGELLRNGAARVADFLDNRVATRDERAKNRAERLDQAKEAVRKTGRGALRVAKTIGLVTFGLTAVSIEAGANTVTYVRQQVVALAHTAQVRMAERRKAKDNAKLEREWAAAKTARMDEISKEEALDEEAYDRNAEHNKEDEAWNMKNEYDQAVADEALEQGHNEAENIRAQEQEQARRDALLRAEIAQRAKALRQARRQERFNNVRDKGGELWKSAKQKAKGFGRIALKTFKFLKRAGKAVAGGVGGAIGGAVVGAARGAVAGARYAAQK